MLFSAIIADPHEITRKGVRQLIEDLGGRVAAEAETASEASGLVKTVEPDLLVSELNLRSGTGLEVLAQVRKQGLLTVPLILSYHQDHAWVSASFWLGAQGFVLKSDPPAAIEAGIRDVLAGGRHLSDRLPEKIKDKSVLHDEKRFPSHCSGEFSDEETDVESALTPLGPLTDRERQVLRLTARGLTAGEIGEHLSISPRTVEKHQQNIRGKLHQDSKVEMARFAFRHDLVPLRAFVAGVAPSEADEAETLQ